MIVSYLRDRFVNEPFTFSGGLVFGIVNIVGNFGTVFCDQAYWQSSVAAKPLQVWYFVLFRVWLRIVRLSTEVSATTSTENNTGHLKFRFAILHCSLEEEDRFSKSNKI